MLRESTARLLVQLFGTVSTLGMFHHTPYALITSRNSELALTTVTAALAPSPGYVFSAGPDVCNCSESAM